MPTLKEQYGSFLKGSLKEKYGQFLDTPVQPEAPQFAGVLPQPDIMPQVGSAGRISTPTGPSLGGRAVAGIIEPAARFLSGQAQELQTDIGEIPHYGGPDWSRGGQPLTSAEQTYAEAPFHKQLGYSAAHTGASLVGGPMGFMASLPQMGLDVVNPPEGQTGLGRIAEEGRGFGQMLANFPEQVRYAGTLGMDRGVDPEAVQSFHQTGGAEPLFTAGILSGVSGVGKAMKPVIPEVRGRYGESGMLPRVRVNELGRIAPEYPRTAPEGLRYKARPRTEWPERIELKPKETQRAKRLRKDEGQLRPGRDVIEVRAGKGLPDLERRAPKQPGRKAQKEVAEWDVTVRQKIKVGRRKIAEDVDTRVTVRAKTAQAAKKAVRDSGKRGQVISAKQVPRRMTPGEISKNYAAYTQELGGPTRKAQTAKEIAAAKKEVAKQPWEMTRDEARIAEMKSRAKHPTPAFSDAAKKALKGYRDAKEKPLVEKGWRDVFGKVESEHRGAIKQALSEGKPVPASVLKDYPDLAKKQATTVPVTAKPPVKSRLKAEKVVSPPPTPPVSSRPAPVKVAEITFAAKGISERWDSAQLGVRVEWAKRSGYVTKAGKLTRTGARLAESKWSAISESGQNVLGRRIAEDYPRLAKKAAKGAVAGAITAAALSDEESRDIALAGVGLAFGATRKGRKAAVEKAVKKPFTAMVEMQKAITVDPFARKLVKGILGPGQQIPGIAGRTTKGGRKVPSIRRSGVFVPEEVTKWKKYEDIPSTLENSMDPTRAIQRMDGSLSLTEKAKTEGQAGPIERNVSWRTRDMMKLRGSWISQMEAKGKTLLKDIDKKGRTALTGQLENKKSTNPKVREVRAFLDELIENQNEIRKLRNQKEIPYRHRYAPHILRRSTIWSQAYGLLNSVEKIMKRGPKDKPSMPDFILPNKPFNPREMARQAGLKGFEREMDFGKLLSQYINTAARDIFNTSIIENNKAFATQMESMGYAKNAAFIQRWTAEAFAGVGGKFDRAIHLTAGTWPVPLLKKAYHKFRRMLVLSAFPLNVGWNTTIQTSSYNFTNTKYGTINSIRGAVDWFTSKEKRQGVKENAYSYIVKRGGSGRMATQDISRGMASQARIIKSKMETARDAMNFFTDLVENNLTGASALAAKRHGENAGLKGKALWEYASDGGAKTQSMYNLEDLPGALRNEIVKTGAPFQTFKFEAYNNLKEWSGKAGVKPESHKVRAKQAITFLAGAYAFNLIGKEITGREPWGHDSFIPFYDVIVGPAIAKFKGERAEYRTKRGLPAPSGVAYELGGAVHDIMVKDDWVRARKWGLRYLPGAVGVGGGTQINRVVDGLIANARGGVYTSSGWESGREPIFPISGTKEKFRSVMFGPYSTTAGKEYLGKRQKSWLDLYRSMRADQNLKGPPERAGRTGRTGRGGR